MDMQSAPEPADLALQLPRDTYFQLVYNLRAAIPPVSDTPEDIAHRDNAIIALIASLLPANADEANLAGLYAMASAQATRSLQLAEQHPSDVAFVVKCHANALRMTREARSTRQLLLRIQAERRRRETDAAAIERAAWTEHCAIGLMAEALGRSPPTQAPEPPPSAMADPVREAERQPNPRDRLPEERHNGPPSLAPAHAMLADDSPVLPAFNPPIGLCANVSPNGP